MDQDTKAPRRLYKYRSFSNWTIEILVSDRLHYSDPAEFNDPLDTKPCLQADLPVPEMRELLRNLIQNRVRAEMEAAAKTIRYRGPKTIEHIDKHSKRRAEEMIEKIAYNANDPSYEIKNPELYLLGQYVEEELVRQYEKGVVSLAERVTCPLMWSHYGDQHKGICIGYSVPDRAKPSLHKVEYGGSRFVRASNVAAMQKGDDAARRGVDDAVWLRKAESWRYEREWRLIGPRGSHDCPLEMEEVIFGMRCTTAVQYAIVKALEYRDQEVKFFEMVPQWGTFSLKKVSLEIDELKRDMRRIRVEDWFEEIEPEPGSESEVITQGS